MKSHRYVASRAAGFSLVELMVGVAIGLVLTLVISQVMTVYEAQTRVTTGTADAQTNGGIALYTISRDLKMAGYGLLPLGDSPLKCTSGIASVSPVAIVNGVAAAGVSASDTITVRYGNSASGGIPRQIISSSPGNLVTMSTNLGCNKDDVAFITNGTSCALTTVTAVDNTDKVTVTLANTTGAISNANLACLGTWNTVTYAVSNGELTRNGSPILAGVVNLQAQYGISATANSNTVTKWVDASGGTWASPSVADRNRIKAVRVAVIARNPRSEPNAVSDACSSTTAAPTGICAWEGTADSPAPTVDLSQGDADWARYRYQTFETIIPLRNVVWSWESL